MFLKYFTQIVQDFNKNIVNVMKKKVSLSLLKIHQSSDI